MSAEDGGNACSPFVFCILSWLELALISPSCLNWKPPAVRQQFFNQWHNYVVTLNHTSALCNINLPFLILFYTLSLRCWRQLNPMSTAALSLYSGKSEAMIGPFDNSRGHFCVKFCCLGSKDYCFSLRNPEDICWLCLTPPCIKHEPKRCSLWSDNSAFSCVL